LLCTEDDNSCYRNVCKMSVVSFALAVVFIIKLDTSFVFHNHQLSHGAQISGEGHPSHDFPNIYTMHNV